MRDLYYPILVFAIISSSAICGQAETIYFPNDDYETIQDTIDNASAGDTIIVRDGSYRENIVVDKSVTIRSENGPDSCIINYAYERGSVFEVTGNQVEISGFTVNGASEPWGSIHLSQSTGSTISGNILFNNNHYAIRLDSSHYNVITGNSTQDSEYAHICLYHSNNNRISGNTCSNNDGTAIGIDLYDSSYNTVESNTCSGNSTGIGVREDSEENTVSKNACEENSWSGVSVSSSNNKVSENTCNNNDRGISISGNNNEVLENTCNHNDYVGLLMREAIGNTISDNSFSNSTSNGILLNGLNVDNEVKNNICNENKGDGISLCAIYTNHDTTISNNTCSKNSGNGITSARASENIKIVGNTCEENGKHGIYLYLSDSYILEQNTANSNEMDGIHVREGADNVVCLNTCNYNTNSGISVSSCWADNTTIAENNVWANEKDGVYLASDDNTVKDNSIISNKRFGVFNIGYENTISGNRLDSNGEVAINNGKKLALPMEEYNIDPNISGNEVLNSPVGVKTTSSRQEDWRDILVDNTFSNVPKRFCQAWTLYVKAVDGFGEPISGAYAEILYKNKSLYKEGWTREDGYLVADEFGFTPAEFYVEDNNGVVYDSPYTINAEIGYLTTSQVILNDNKEATIYFASMNVSGKSQMNVHGKDISLDSALVTLYGKTNTAIKAKVTVHPGDPIQGVDVNFTATAGYFVQSALPNVVRTTDENGEASCVLSTEDLYKEHASLTKILVTAEAITTGQTKRLMIPLIDNVAKIKEYYYFYVPSYQTAYASGAEVNIHEGLCASHPNKYTPWVCAGYQDTVLNLLDRIRLNDGSYSEHERTDYLLNGIEYGPVQSFGLPYTAIAFHHAVVIYLKNALWENEGEILDPWITQYPVIYRAWIWREMMLTMGPERTSHMKQYPLQGSVSYPSEPAALGGEKICDPYEKILPPCGSGSAGKRSHLGENQATGVVQCPVDILITDSEGARAGVLPDGTFVNESEYAIVTCFDMPEDEKVCEVFMNFTDIAQIDFRGTAEGAFTAQFLFNGSSHSLLDRYSNVPIANGETASLVIDETQSFPIILGNGTQIYPDETDPPATVGNLHEIEKHSRRILWEWDNPVDADFDHALIYVDERYKGKVTKPEHTYLATGLDPETEYTISVYTVDELGNMNIAEVNDTATTSGGILLNQGWNLFSPIIEPIDETTDRNIPLTKGWNMFGYSSDTELSWINALVSDGVFPIPAVMAPGYGWLQPTVYYYDANAYRGVPTFDDTLRKNKGYCVYAYKDNLTLILPGAGGSLIGNSCLWADAQLENATEIKALQDAQQAGWLQGTTYYFDENTQYYESIQAGDYIYPWRGYWLWANEENLVLTFAESSCGVSESADSFQLQFYHYMDDEPGVRDPSITPDTFAAIGSTDPNVAIEGMDYKDGAQPPAIPNGDYVRAYTDPNIPGTPVITIDYRPLDPNNPNLPDLHYPIDLIAYDDGSVGLTGTIYFNLMDPNELNDIPAEAMVCLRRLDENGSFVEWYNLRDPDNHSIWWRVTSAQGLHATMELEILDKSVAANADGRGLVDFHDFATLAGDWKKTETNVRLAGDLDGNGEVNSEDLALIMQHWLRSCD